MSDRVIVGTTNNTGIPALSSGFNGFLEPEYTGLPAIGTAPYSVQALTLAEAIRWWYRVKRWSLSTDFAAGGYAVPNGPLLPSPPIASEWPWVSAAAHISSNGSDPGDLPAEAGAEFILGNRFKRSGANYHPGIFIGGRAYNAVDSLMIFRTDLFGIVPDGSIMATVDGKQIPLYYQQTHFPGVVTHTFFDLTPIEYWPYAAKDGSPIYDTATGAQLQDPRN